MEFPRLPPPPSLETLISTADKALRSIFAPAQAARPLPVPAGSGTADTQLTDHERREAAALMRVNHTGEVAAQALYHGQAFVARSEQTREMLLESRAGRDRSSGLVRNAPVRAAVTHKLSQSALVCGFVCDRSRRGDVRRSHQSGLRVGDRKTGRGSSRFASREAAGAGFTQSRDRRGHASGRNRARRCRSFGRRGGASGSGSRVDEAHCAVDDAYCVLDLSLNLSLLLAVLRAYV